MAYNTVSFIFRAKSNVFLHHVTHLITIPLADVENQDEQETVVVQFVVAQGHLISHVCHNCVSV